MRVSQFLLLSFAGILVFLSGLSSQGGTVFDVDFDSPTYDDSNFSSILGQDGWYIDVADGDTAEPDSNWVQDATLDFGSDQIGVIGFRNPPRSDLFATLTRDLSLDPVAQNLTKVTLQTDLRLDYLTPDIFDTFVILFNNAAGESFNAVRFNMGSNDVETGNSGAIASIAEDTNYQLWVEMDFLSERLNLSLDGGQTLIGNNLDLDAIGVSTLNFTSISVLRFGTDLDSENIMMLDDIQITAVPEPTIGALLLGGGIVFLLRRRKKAGILPNTYS